MRLFFIIISLLFAIQVSAQNHCKYVSEFDSLTRLSEQDLFYLSKVPVLEVNRTLLKSTLPPVVDNSTQPYFRPIWAQSDYCCGQAASILYMFTYEMNRLRDLPSNVTSNQYPTHFAWNWMNGPDNNRGVSYMNSLELLKFTGTPNVTDWGGTPDFGGGTRWMSGYSKYYNGMQNKVDEYYSLNVGTPDGIMVLKNWLHNHNENSTVGGVACIYILFTNPAETLPAGTAEAGKLVITQWGASANHGMVILGYNDSIRWDYNNDGMYTNNIDINGDGVVDVKDWEIGGVKLVNDFGTGWANGGYCYAMYKTLADKFGQGGIWNNAVHVVKPKQTYAPLLTYKVILEHSSRREISIEAGVSSNLTDTIPQHTIENTIVNFQGGDKYMLGGTNPSDLSMEFGVDVTPLLNYIQSGQPARFFFRVREYDRDLPSDGQVTSFSIMDYSSGIIETSNPNTPLSIVDNSITSLWIDYTPVFNRPEIVEDTLSGITLYENLNQQLTATGGQPPYKWKMRMNYTEQETQESFPNVTATQLNLGSWTSGKAEVLLNFSFPFYNKSYTKMYVHTDGFITFESEDLPWVYFYDEDKTTLMKYFRGIAVFASEIEMLGGTNGTWMEQYSDSIVIRWNGTVPDYLGGHYEVNFAVKLRSDGSISYYYSNSETHGFQWVAGASNGDYTNWQHLSFSNSTFTINGEKSFRLDPGNVNFLNDIRLTESGVLQGIVTEAYDDYPVVVEVTDNQGIKNSKVIRLTTQGIQFDYTVLSGGDSIIEYGETAEMGFVVRNIGSTTLNNINFTLSSSSTNVDWTDSTFDIASLAPDQEVVVPMGAIFEVGNPTLEGEILPLIVDIESSGLQQSRQMNLVGHRPLINIVSSFIEGTNSPILFSGDTARLFIILKNNSDARTINGEYLLQNISPYISLLSGVVLIDTLDRMETDTVFFDVVVSTTCPWETIVQSSLEVIARDQFVQTLTLDIMINFNVEVFETGDLTAFDWTGGGDADWFVVQPGYNGQYAARSGVITNDQSSVMELTLETTEDGDIKFFRKTSSEQNYDYLKFYIDNSLKGEWSGINDWALISYPVVMGLHTFRWEYSKDISVSSGSDCAWIDNVILPPLDESNLPFLTASPLSFSHSMPPDAMLTDTLTLSNIGGGKLVYRICSINGQPWINKSINGSYLQSGLTGFYAGDTISIPLTLHNGSPDSEWLKDMGIVLPNGISLISTESFIGGSGGALNYTGLTVPGDTLKWHGETAAGWGVVYGGENAQSTLTLYVSPTFSGNLEISYRIYGDIYGALPHTIDSVITLSNLGQELPWLTFALSSDTIFESEQKEVVLTFNSSGLAQGVYTCDLEVSSGFDQQYIIPVELKVSYLQFNPLTVYEELYPDSSLTSEILITNFYHLPFFVSAEVDYPLGATDTLWLEVAPAAAMIPSNTTIPLVLQLNATGLSFGTYFATVSCMDQQYFYTELPVVLHVLPAMGVEMGNVGNGMLLYPNPIQDIFNIEFSNEMNSVTVEIFNSTGQRVLIQTELAPPYQLNLAGYSAGLYSVRVICGDKVFTARLVKKN